MLLLSIFISYLVLEFYLIPKVRHELQRGQEARTSQSLLRRGPLNRADFMASFPQQPVNPTNYNTRLARIAEAQEALRAKAREGMPAWPGVKEGDGRTAERQEEEHRYSHTYRLGRAWDWCEWSRRWARLGYPKRSTEALDDVWRFIEDRGTMQIGRGATRFSRSPGEKPEIFPWDPDLPGDLGDPKKWKKPKEYVPYAETANAESASLQPGETLE